MMVAYTYQKNIGTPNTGSIIGNTATPTTIGRTVGRASLVAGAISGGSGNTAGGSGSQNPDNRYADVALTADDIPNILNIAGSYELPFGKGKRFLSGSRIGNVLFGGWTLTNNWNFQDGVPLVINAPCNGLQGEIGVCRPNLIGNPNQFSGSRSKVDRENQWFNPNAFQAAFQTNPAILTAPDPTIYNEWWQFGNMGVRNGAVRSPGLLECGHVTIQELLHHRSALPQLSVGGLQRSQSPESRDTQYELVSAAECGRFDRSGSPVRMSVREDYERTNGSESYAVRVEVRFLILRQSRDYDPSHFSRRSCHCQTGWNGERDPSRNT